eukprot:5790338-Ditylum_brightwellii.AAC.1
MRRHAAVIHISVIHALRQSYIGRTPTVTPALGISKVNQYKNAARLTTKGKVHQVRVDVCCTLFVEHPFLLLILDPPQELSISQRKVEPFDIMSKVIQHCFLNFVLEGFFGEELELVLQINAVPQYFAKHHLSQLPL